MQGKGLVQFFTVSLILVCIYQLSFTWKARSVKNDAKSYAIEYADRISTSGEAGYDSIITSKKKFYLDSVANIKDLFDLGIVGFSYNEVKDQQISLGLDLQGGMNVVLQVSLEEMIRSMTRNSKDPDFNAAIAKAKELERNAQVDFVTLFDQAYKEQAPDGKLAALFATKDYADKIDFNSTNEEVIKLIREEAKDAFQRTYNILRTRIDQFGVTQPNITAQELTGRIIIELPGADDPERIRSRLQARAKLEFWEVYDQQEIAQAFNSANTKLRSIVKSRKSELEAIETDTAAGATIDEVKTDNPVEAEADEDVVESDTSAEEATDTTDELAGLLGEAEDEDGDSLTFDQFKEENPLFAIFQMSSVTNEAGQRQYSGGPVIGYALEQDTTQIMRYLEMQGVNSLLPRNAKLLWGASPYVDEQSGTESWMLYAMKMRGVDNKAPLEGDVITNAVQQMDPMSGKVEIQMRMNTDGAKKWKRLTAANVGKSVAVVLDDKVYTAPTVQSEISGGVSSISGDFDISEAQDLAIILKVGKLPAPAKILDENVVGPTLGEKSISAGMNSLVLGLVLVLVFMILYYNGGGVVSNIALIANIFFIAGALASLKATLTLPGMAGIVLTIGMAVDANVIIYERIREELEKGKGMKLAITDGFKHSYSAIIDANLTTLLTAIVLAYFGMGPILGFATVLIIGILSSMFTAILITRLTIDGWIAKDRKISFSNSITKGAFKNINIDFIGKRKIAYVVSSIVVAAGIFSFATNGFDLGVDFEGGRNYVVQFDENVSTQEVRESLTDHLDGAPIVKTYGDGNQVKISTAYLVDSNSAAAGKIVEEKLFAGLQPFLGDTDLEDFKSNHIMSSQRVGPTIADDIKEGAYWATIFALIIMFLYILIRFRKWQFGLGAVTALAHNVIVVLAIFSLFQNVLPFSLEIDQAFIAALLTIIGYSINDTVVVFDRIREYLETHHTKDMPTTINNAINSTLSRTLITSFTTLLVITILFLFGGEVIRGFSFALMIGVLVGTYSSIFIATPIVVDLTKDPKKVDSKK